MELKFLGVGSAFSPELGNNSAYFVKEKNLFLLDCGENVFTKIKSQFDLEEFNNIYTMITHRHSDHIGSLSSLILYSYYIYNIKVDILSPDDKITDLLKLMGLDRDIYNHDVSNNYYLSNIDIRFIRTNHTRTMPCYGIYLQDENERIYYSGDSNSFPEYILEKFLSGHINRIYQDICSSKVGNPNHMKVEYLLDKIPGNLLKKIYGMHLNKNEIEEISKIGINLVKIEK